MYTARVSGLSDHALGVLVVCSSQGSMAALLGEIRFQAPTRLMDLRGLWRYPHQSHYIGSLWRGVPKMMGTVLGVSISSNDVVLGF